MLSAQTHNININNYLKKLFLIIFILQKILYIRALKICYSHAYKANIII